MPNICTTNYVIEGKKEELDALYQVMANFEVSEQYMIDESNWLGNLVSALGKDPEDVICRGEWTDLKRENDTLRVTFETAWTPCYEVIQLMKEMFPSLRIYYQAEELGNGIYTKNDAEGIYFPDTETDGHTIRLMTPARGTACPHRRVTS